MEMSETLSLTSGAPGRYATALFNLCKEKGQLKLLQKDVEKLSELILKRNDFKSLIASPVYNRGQQERAVSAVGQKIKIQKYTENLLQLMAKKGRIYTVPELIRDIDALLEDERGETRVEVTSAESLSKAQTGKLENTISKIVDKKAKMYVGLDKSLIGGMIVKIGSRMIDTTIKSKLVKLQNIMKEVN